MKYDPLYAAYLVYFNRDRDYFECHEVLEELWLARDRDPRYKGLLQAAVGLYHFRNGNVRGSYKMMRSAHARLQPYPAEELGIRMAKLVSEISVYAARLASYDTQPFPYHDLTIEIVDSELVAIVAKASAEIQPNVPQRRGPQRAEKHKVE
ncbi:DUF309 domain-containing protein [Paenibacillus sp. N3/727]|uniref:DUF309 domain-containing protein n=1 Tax=Paenibacillus sp. N3/727 TaxID=2925845 RepID=UPI001F52D00A|nr:DUF309 domain-containing protein [Paenibacillus sp. N3/727]UNK17057.1 DUF309 domain-containing protein [Paenibacillus sp. N3/727]